MNFANIIFTVILIIALIYLPIYWHNNYVLLFLNREIVMGEKIFSLIVILLAVAMGILASVLPSERLADLVLISKFFLSMIPVLAVGALLKYIIKF